MYTPEYVPVNISCPTIINSTRSSRFLASSRRLDRVDAGREESANRFAIKMKARVVVGRGEKSLLSDPGSELKLSRGRKTKKSREEN